MTEEKDTGDESAQDQQDQDLKGDQDKDQTDLDQDKGQDDKGQKPFTEQQEQYLGSWLGRIVAKQLDDKVMPMLNRDPNPIPANIPETGSEDAVTKFNEKLQEKIFSGDVLGAIQMAQDVQSRAKSNLTKTQKIETDKLITSYSDKPYYKDIFTEMKKMSHEYAGQGFPPEAATEYAYTKAKADFLEKKLGGGDGEDTENLEMLGGGKAS
ncbi:unnamed protein product, partial [marine sediment metagenome]